MSTKIYVIAALLLVPFAAGSFSASQQERQRDRKPMMERCQAMAEQHQQMKTQMKEMDRELEQKLEAMRSAGGDEKVEAIADLAEELATQRLKMHERMTATHQRGMMHMMQHMSSEEGRRMMDQCPMMKAMSGSTQDDDGGR